jgi:hypothetical protein
MAETGYAVGAPASEELASGRGLAGARTRLRGIGWLVPVSVTWGATRVLILALGWCASWLARRHAFHFSEPVLFRGPRPATVIGGWDGDWYQLIARIGYPTHLAPHHYSRLAFFPLLPALIFIVHQTGLSTLIAGLLVANIASLFALWAVAALTESYFDGEIAERAAVYLAISPMAYVLGMVYSEPLLLASGFGAAALMLRGRPWLAVPLGLACGLSRPTGALIVVPLVVIAYRARERRPAMLAAAVAPIVGLSLFAAYLWWHTGDALIFQRAQLAWGRHAISLEGLGSLVDRSTLQLSGRPSLWLLRDVGGLLVTLALLCYGVARRFPLSWTLFGFACVLIPAASDSSVSLARFGLVALPAFWALAVLGRNRSFDHTYRILGPALMSVGMLTVPLHWP